MPHFFIKTQQINEHTISVIGSDVHHIRDVLRMKAGDELSFSDGVEMCKYHAVISDITADEVRCELRYIQAGGYELPIRVHLYQALPKAAKMEWIIEKAVELGVYRVIPITTTRSIVRLEQKKATAKRERWQTISETAAKQCGRLIVPVIEEVTTLQTAIADIAQFNTKIIPYEMTAQSTDFRNTRDIIGGIRRGEDVAVFIGSEGGFEPREIEMAVNAGIVPITMGKRILRTETAATVILAWLMFCCDQV
ncbi:MAG: 16S rRNA (uracil(1498)-N(3))-methyltransferase [Lachnospiraceae bacterium]|jgi:16S rRNA (uracil1498-N3)-methyltransferase|nr:16S rRNA (uracil(1498)-N(3))-methyltransferase [Lachnospiraceae bacterium]